MNFNKIKTLVLAFLGVPALIENKLSTEQEQKVKDFYGDDLLGKFKVALASENPEDHSAELFEAMKAVFAPEAVAAKEEVVEALNTANQVIAQQRAQISTLLNSPEEAPVASNTNTFTGKEGVAEVMKVSGKVSHYAAAFAVLMTGSMAAAQGSSIDVSDLRKEFGTYLSQNGNNLSLSKQIFSGFSSAKYFRSVPALTEYRAIQTQINSVVQKFKPKWTPNGSTKFTPLVIKNYRHKINVPIIPAHVLDSYLFHLYDEGLAPAQMPITKYIWNELIYPKILDDIELRMIFKGKYVENDDPDQPTKPEESMDGILTTLIKEKANPNTRVKFFNKPLDLATATSEQIVQWVNDYADFVDEDELGITKMFASRSFRKIYQRAYEKEFGAGNKQVGGINKSAEVDYVDMEVVDLKGMRKTPIIFSTIDGNMVKLRHKNEVPNIVNKVVETHYSVDIVGEFWLGAGFEIAEFVYAYIPEGFKDAQAGLKPSNQFPDGTSPDVDAGDDEDDDDKDGI